VRQSLAEVRRLEGLFSLYQPHSAICTLNRTGALAAPDPDMVALLRAALSFSNLPAARSIRPCSRCAASRRAFFLAIGRSGRPARRQARGGAGEGRPRRCPGERGPHRVVAAGCGADAERHRPGLRHRRVADMLRARAVHHTGRHGRGEGARRAAGRGAVAGRLADADQPGRLGATVAIVDARWPPPPAPASGSTAPAASRIVRSRTGRSPARYHSVSVIAPTATEADALSTAFSLLPPESVGALVAARQNLQRVLSLVKARHWCMAHKTIVGAHPRAIATR